LPVKKEKKFSNTPRDSDGEENPKKERLKKLFFML